MIEPVLPMLATSAAPFDSSAYEFEVKWDGVRALAAVEGNRWRLWGRELADYGGRYRSWRYSAVSLPAPSWTANS